MIAPAQNFAVAVTMNFEGAVPFPYAQKLYEAVLNEPWSIAVYTKNGKELPFIWDKLGTIISAKACEKMGIDALTEGCNL